MNTVEVFDFAIAKINELKKEEGLFFIEISSYVFDDDDEDDKTLKSKLLKDYNKEINIPPEKWCFVYFDIYNAIVEKKVQDLRIYLNKCGIYFNTSYFEDIKEWGFDWSFHYEKDIENLAWNEMRKYIENTIKNDEKKLKLIK